MHPCFAIIMVSTDIDGFTKCGPTLFAKLTLTLKLDVSSVHWSQLTLMVNLQHWPNVGPTLFSLLTLILKLDVSRVHWHNVGRTLFSQLTLVSTYIDGRFTTLTQCWPDFVCQTNIDTQVICKCTLTQCLPNIVFLLALTLKLTVSSEHWPNVGPTLYYNIGSQVRCVKWTLAQYFQPMHVHIANVCPTKSYYLGQY